MLLQNNPEIDTKLLEEKLRPASQRSLQIISNPLEPVFISLINQTTATAIEAPENTLTHAGVAVDSTPITHSSHLSRMRTLIKRLPVIGPVFVWTYRQLSSIRQAGSPMRHRVLQIPLFGPLIGWTYSIFRLNRIRQKIASDLATLQQIINRLDQTTLNIDQRLGQLDRAALPDRLQHLEQMNIGIRLNRLDALDIGNRLNFFDSANIVNRLNGLDALEIGQRFAQFDQLDQSQQNMQLRIIDRDHQIADLMQKFNQLQQKNLTGLVAGIDAKSATASVEKENSSMNLDSFYVEFEKLFRGQPDDIRDRLRVYLPYVTRFANDASARLVDIGCGRGEWLELLKHEKINAIGIDLNQRMVEECRERELTVEWADAIAYLLEQPANSVAAVSGFHIIEHLNFETQIALFDAAFRALRTDGVLIFETPNPENLVVAACHFYSDPTHLRPVVPAVAEFMARQRGFARAEILPLHPYPNTYFLPEDSEMAIRINRAFYGPQDFALVAWKTQNAVMVEPD